MPTVGDRIKEFREDLGWTQEQLAQRTKLSKGFLSDVENNKRNISANNVLKIANVMGASLDYLLRGEKSKPTHRREAIQIPSTLSTAAEQLKLSYSETLTVLETYQSVIARRSNESIRQPSVEDWKTLYKLIKAV
jgi:transcriptional regulator with XRE-family HTH domain